jgi:hypothetical protein
MKKHTVGIIMNGVTGRMGTNQHLIRSIAAIIDQGGVEINANEFILPDVVLVGRNETKLKKLAKQTGIENWTTDLENVVPALLKATLKLVHMACEIFWRTRLAALIFSKLNGPTIASWPSPIS